MSDETVSVVYRLPGGREYQARLYPTTETYKDFASIVAHYTESSLHADGIPLAAGTGVRVRPEIDGHSIEFTVPSAWGRKAKIFAERHQTMLDADHAGQALNGCDRCMATPGAWNPMSGFAVSKHDGPCEWKPFLPLGMALSRNRAVTLMHYPPIAALRSADYLENMTLERWRRLLSAVGFGPDELYRYCTTLDVNPVAAPGSGQSEYANDYFPTLLTSAFFDNEPAGCNYVRAMLEFLLNPPYASESKYTLPLLVCGSPLYDPQAASWFRVRYKDQLFVAGSDVNGACPVGTAGSILISPTSKRRTPFLIANHMIAAGVTWKCTPDASKIPDIRQYEAQDLVAASFLEAYADDPDTDPADALRTATDRWFGAGFTFGQVPAPASSDDRLTACAMAQVDMFFDPVHIKPVLTVEQALARCKALSAGTDDPCCAACKVPPTPSPAKHETMPCPPAAAHTSSGGPSAARFVAAVRGEEYDVFRFRPGAASDFERVSGGSFPSGQRFAQIGAYVLSWSYKVETVDGIDGFAWRLFPFDPGSADPLNATGGLSGFWPAKKFFTGVADFSDPTGGHQKHDGDILELIPMGGNFVLHIIPNKGRGTFRLWNFDPQTLTGDPLSIWMDPGAFDDIQAGVELLPLGDQVVDHVPGTGRIRIWSFDPMLPIPLSKPILGSATLPGQKADAPDVHLLTALGTELFDRATDGSWRTWALADLSRPQASGVLPEAVRSATRVVGLEALDEVDDARSRVPGTLDFLRERIKHVVYYMIENRSLDHTLGKLYERGESGRVTVGPTGPWDGVDGYSNPYDGVEVSQSPYEGGRVSVEFNLDFPMADPYHNHSDVMRQMFGAAGDWRGRPDMKGFCVNNGSSVVMQYYTPQQLPVLNGLARSFAASDRWFCSLPGGTDANRAFSLGGSSQGHLDNFQNGSQYAYWPDAPHRPNIWKTLWSNGVTDWKIYNACTWMNHVFTYHLFLAGQIPSVDAGTDPDTDHSTWVQPIDQFFADAANGTLPAFSYVEPIWIAQRDKTSTSYHPGEDLIPCEAQLRKIYDALAASPKWSETLLVITFDEHGGLFDHVVPPEAIPPWPNEVIDGFAFDRLGPRVPTILVSPLIATSTVFRSATGTDYDATSFLATLLRWFGVPESRWGLGERTTHAPTFEGAFTLAAPRPDVPKFELASDKSYPPGSDPFGPSSPGPAHSLHQSMAARDVAVAGRGRPKAEVQPDIEKIQSTKDLAELRALSEAARSRPK